MVEVLALLHRGIVVPLLSSRYLSTSKQREGERGRKRKVFGSLGREKQTESGGKRSPLH